MLPLAVGPKAAKTHTHTRMLSDGVGVVSQRGLGEVVTRPKANHTIANNLNKSRTTTSSSRTSLRTHGAEAEDERERKRERGVPLLS